MNEIGHALSQITELSKAMLATPEDDRVLIYKKIDPYFLKLEAALLRSPNACAAEKLAELKLHLITLARLDDPDGHSDEQHCSWALEAIDTLSGTRCFGMTREA